MTGRMDTPLFISEILISKLGTIPKFEMQMTETACKASSVKHVASSVDARHVERTPTFELLRSFDYSDKRKITEMYLSRRVG